MVTHTHTLRAHTQTHASTMLVQYQLASSITLGQGNVGPQELYIGDQDANLLSNGRIQLALGWVGSPARARLTR